MKLYDTWFYRIWKRFLTWFGDIQLSTSPPEVGAKDIRKLMSLVKPGDVICRRYDRYLDSYFIPGKYSHSCVVIDENTVMDAVAEGVGRRDIMDFVMDTDGFILLRPNYENENCKTLAIDYALRQEGKPYDFWFLDGENAFYCHEFTVRSVSRGSIVIPLINGSHYLAENLISCCQTIMVGGK